MCWSWVVGEQSGWRPKAGQGGEKSKRGGNLHDEGLDSQVLRAMHWLGKIARSPLERVTVGGKERGLTYHRGTRKKSVIQGSEWKNLIGLSRSKTERCFYMRQKSNNSYAASSEGQRVSERQRGCGKTRVSLWGSRGGCCVFVSKWNRQETGR